MIAVLVTVLVLAFLALALALADRIFANLAERKASQFLSAPFGHPPTVRVMGAPFLTQALRGRYREIHVSGGGLQLGEISGATLDAHLHDALLPPRELLGGRADSLFCRRVEGRIVLPYGEIARASRVPGLSLAFERDRLIASAALPVPGISQVARVSGHADLSVNGKTVWLQVRRFAVAGISLPSLVVAQLMPSLNVAIPIPDLPYGLRLDDLQPTASGLVVHGAAGDVLFTAADVALGSL